MDELVVDLNRTGANTIEPQREQVVTDERLRVRLHTHDQPARIHLRLEGAWTTTLSLPDPNLLVTPEIDRIIELAPPQDQLPVTGQLIVSTGYGSTSRSITVELTAAETTPEAASTPESTTTPGTTLTTAVDGEALGVVGVLVLAVVTAISVVAVVGPQLPVLIGAGMVIATAMFGVVYLYGRPRD